MLWDCLVDILAEGCNHKYHYSVRQGNAAISKYQSGTPFHLPLLYVRTRLHETLIFVLLPVSPRVRGTLVTIRCIFSSKSVRRLGGPV